MNWKGKRAIFLGDSITEGALASCPEDVYHQIVGRKLGFSKTINCGKSGTRIARQWEPSENPSFDMDFNQRADALDPEADLVVVFGGTNDFGHGDAPLGAFGDDTVYTFYGACRCLFEKLAKKYGREKILAIMPLQRVDEENPFGDGSKKRAGAILKDYVAALSETAQSMGIRILDLWSDEKLNPNIDADKKYFGDGLHHNDAGDRILAEKISDCLSTL